MLFRSDSLGKWFLTEGYEVEMIASAREALAAIQSKGYDLALVDIKMPGMDGMELQSRLRDADPDLLVIIMTGFASVDTAVQALKRGAYDYITKPFDVEDIELLVRRALDKRNLEREVLYLRSTLPQGFDAMIGRHPEMVKIYQLIAQIAPTSATVLVTGESGTGKELVARALHRTGPRRNGPFVAINCAAVPEIGRASCRERV